MNWQSVLPVSTQVWSISILKNWIVLPTRRYSCWMRLSNPHPPTEPATPKGMLRYGSFLRMLRQQRKQVNKLSKVWTPALIYTFIFRFIVYQLVPKRLFPLKRNHISVIPQEARTGFEPVISCVTGRRDNPYTIGPNCGSRIWTYDLRVMSPTSYQTAPSRDNNLKRWPVRDLNPCYRRERAVS